jgi:hypothetical protein
MANPRGSKPKIPAPPGFRGCAACLQIKPEDEFYPKGGTRRESYCKPCKRTLKNSDKHRFTWNIAPEEVTRFWENSERAENGCLVWTSYKNSYGYGQFYLNGRQLGAHRIAWKLAGHELPKWPTVIDHTCRNRACVDVAHMRAVSQRTNTLENSDSPHSHNARLTHCAKCGNEYAGANLAIVPAKDKKGRPTTSRCCLTCYPGKWRFAVVKRGPPPGRLPRKHTEWLGPARPHTRSC